MFGLENNESKEDLSSQITATEWLNEILKEAVKQKASDIHIVPYADRMVANFRIDGAMRTIDEWDKSNHEKVISRIKVIAGLDVVERQTPQDGHMQIILHWPRAKKERKKEVKDIASAIDEILVSRKNADEKSENEKTKQEESKTEKTKENETSGEDERQGKDSGDPEQVLANFRVSVMPTIYGEVAVLRGLNRATNLMKIEELGFSEKVLPQMMEMIRRSHGVMLLTGPTGAGKTTTLYSILNRIREKEKTILTLEDPVEYRLEGVRQTQVRPNDPDGLTWSEGLKASLRQDPDTLMVGEIRDEETAEIAIHAALSGRQVFSTFHTSSVEGVLIQLIDMHIGRSPIASAINGIVTQRLVRKICEDCRVEEAPSLELLQVLGIDSWTEGTVFAGEGCRMCDGSGYRGRIGLFEVLTFDDDLRAEILQKTSFREIEAMTRRKIPQSLKEDGISKVQKGITTLEEIVRAVV